MSRFDSFDEANLTGSQRLRLAQQNARDFDQAMLQRAHERSLAQRAHFLEMNPSSGNMHERQWLANRQANARQDELDARRFGQQRDLVDRQAGAAVALQREKNVGLINQGVGAARINAAAAADKNTADYLRSEAEWAARRDIAQLQGEYGLESAEISADAEKYKSDAGVDAEVERGKNLLEQDRQRQQMINEGRENVARINAESAKARAEMKLDEAQQKRFDAFNRDLLDPQKLQTLPPAERERIKNMSLEERLQLFRNSEAGGTPGAATNENDWHSLWN